jgi:hypothetical protein
MLRTNTKLILKFTLLILLAAAVSSHVAGQFQQGTRKGKPLIRFALDTIPPGPITPYQISHVKKVHAYCVSSTGQDSEVIFEHFVIADNFNGDRNGSHSVFQDVDTSNTIGDFMHNNFLKSTPGDIIIIGNIKFHDLDSNGYRVIDPANWRVIDPKIPVTACKNIFISLNSLQSGQISVRQLKTVTEVKAKQENMPGKKEKNYPVKHYTMILKTFPLKGEPVQEVFNEMGNKIPIELRSRLVHLMPGDQIVIRNVSIHTEEFKTLNCDRTFTVVE